MDVVRKIESNPTNSGNKPNKDVVIEDCGQLELPGGKPFSVDKADATA